MVSMTPSFDGLQSRVSHFLIGASDLVRNHGEKNVRDIVIVRSAQLL